VAAADGRRHVLAIGGFAGPRFDQGVPRLVRHAVELAGQPSPRVCLIGTAMGDDAASVLRGYAWLQLLELLGLRPDSNRAPRAAAAT
jgi:hypothetical protein